MGDRKIAKGIWALRGPCEVVEQQYPNFEIKHIIEDQISLTRYPIKWYWHIPEKRATLKQLLHAMVDINTQSPNT